MKTARKKRWSARLSRLKCTRSLQPVGRLRSAAMPRLIPRQQFCKPSVVFLEHGQWMSMYKTTCREKEHLCIEIKKKKETDREFLPSITTNFSSSLIVLCLTQGDCLPHQEMHYCIMWKGQLAAVQWYQLGFASIHHQQNGRRRLSWVRQYGTLNESFKTKAYRSAMPWKALEKPGSNLRHQITFPIGSSALYRLSQIRIYKNRWFIGEF